LSRARGLKQAAASCLRALRSADYKALGAVVSVVVSLASLAIATKALVNNERAMRESIWMFGLQRRPWIKVELRDVRVHCLFLDSTMTREIARCVQGSYRGVNVGRGEACFPRFATRADTSKGRDNGDTLRSLGPMLAPGDSTLWVEFQDTVFFKHPQNAYLHVLCDYTSSETQLTYRLQDVRYLTRDGKYGQENTYLGHIERGMILWER